MLPQLLLNRFYGKEFFIFLPDFLSNVTSCELSGFNFRPTRPGFPYMLPVASLTSVLKLYRAYISKIMPNFFRHFVMLNSNFHHRIFIRVPPSSLSFQKFYKEHGCLSNLYQLVN